MREGSPSSAPGKDELKRSFLARLEAILALGGEPVDVERAPGGPRLVEELTLSSFADVAFALGQAPLDVTLAPIEDVRAYVAETPSGKRSGHDFDRWRQRREVKRALAATRVP